MDDDTKLAAVAIVSPPIIAVLTAIVIMDGSADTALTFVLMIAAAFAALGIYQLSGRGAWLTAGYNTMAPEEKAQYDQRSIARGSGIIMLGTAALAATCIFGTVFLVTGIVILIACIICGIAVMKKAGRESISDRPDIRSCTAVCRDLMLCRDLMSIRKAQLNTMMRTGVPRPRGAMKVEQMKILYFTATGNSLAVAKAFGGELMSIPHLVRDGVKEIEDDIVGIVSPTYLADAPKMVASFLKSTAIKTDYLFGVFTYGFEAGGVVEHAQSYAEQGGRRFDYLNTIKMVDNAIERFETGKELEKLPEKDVEGHLKTILSDIGSRKKYIGRVTVRSRIADAAYHAFGKGSIASDRAKTFIIDGSCVKCGTCAKVCPADNIIVDENGVRFLDRCEGCLGCLHNCPKTAIHLKREKSSARFRNADVSLREIIESNE